VFGWFLFGWVPEGATASTLFFVAPCVFVGHSPNTLRTPALAPHSSSSEAVCVYMCVVLPLLPRATHHYICVHGLLCRGCFASSCCSAEMHGSGC
jgi:hypothetical protein